VRPYDRRVPEPTLQDLTDRVEDLARVAGRQADSLARLADEAKARAARDRAGADVPLLADLFALRSDAAACAGTGRTRRERDAFGAVAAGLERLLVGRGGALVVPAVGDAFDPATMEAAEVRATEDPALDRLVAAVLTDGLRVAGGRSVRAARVAVWRHRPA
jgi:molecular chaperone GrpE